MKHLLLFLLSFAVALADTTIYLRDGNYPAKRVTTCSDNGDYIRCTIPAHGFSVGWKVAVTGANGCWRANGTRTVAAVPDANTVDFLGADGVTVLDCGGTFAVNANLGIVLAGRASAYSLKDPPSVHPFDGPAGAWTTGLATIDTAGSSALERLPYTELKTRIDLLKGSYGTYNTYNPYWNSTSAHVAALGGAIVWRALGSPVCPPGDIVVTGARRTCSSNANADYLLMAIDLLNRADRIWNNAGCYEPGLSCGRGANGNAIDYNAPDLQYYPRAFSLVYDQMTSGERQLFADKFLNDNGQDNDSQTNCTNAYTIGEGTLTAPSTGFTVTVTPASAIAGVNVGDYVAWATGTSTNISDSGAGVYVTAKDDMTGVLTVNLANNSPFSKTATDRPWMYASPDWVTGRCGHIWLNKHYTPSPISAPQGYPVSGGNSNSRSGNLTWAKTLQYALIGSATCPVDERGCRLFEAAWAHYYDMMRFTTQNLFSGYTSGGSWGYRGRVEGHSAEMALMGVNSITPPIDTRGSQYIDNYAYMVLFQSLSPVYMHTWGNEKSNAQPTLGDSEHVVQLTSALAGKTSGEYLAYWMRNRWAKFYTANWGSDKSRLGFSMNFPPTATATDYTSALTSRRLFYNTELNEDYFGNPLQFGLLGAISKSSWVGDGSATSVQFAPHGYWNDHSTTYAPGAVEIFKHHYLLTGWSITSSSTMASCSAAGDVSCYSRSAQGSSGSVEIGTPSPTSTAADYYLWVRTVEPDLINGSGSVGSRMRLMRWAGANPGGRTEGDYTYLAYDADETMATSLQTNVLADQHHRLHVTAGGRELVFTYDRAKSTSALRKRQFWNFANNGQTGEGTTYADSNGLIVTTTDPALAGKSRMFTHTLVPTTKHQSDVGVSTSGLTLTINGQATVGAPMTINAPGRSVQCSYTTPINVTAAGTGVAYVWADSACAIHVGHNGLTLSGTGFTDDSGVTAFPGGNTYEIASVNYTGSAWSVYYSALPYSPPGARRFTVLCGTGTEDECLAAHEIHGDQTTPSVPFDAPMISADWITVEHQHATLPTVVAFARGDACKESWSATTDHAATAQYVLAGLCPGSYSIQRGADAPTAATVNPGDESLGFAGEAGAYAVARTGAGPTIATTSLPEGTVGAPYSAALSGVCSAVPCVWTVLDALPPGLSFSVDTISGTPSAQGSTVVTVRYTDNNGLWNERDLTIQINAGAGQPLAFEPADVVCVVGEPCAPAPAASGGTEPYSYVVTVGALPPGLSMSSAGVFSGTPTQLGDFVVSIRVTDGAAAELTRVVTVRVQAPVGAADFGVRWTRCAAMACQIAISRLEFPASATIYGTVRDAASGNEVKRFEMEPGPATRRKALTDLPPGANLQVELLGDGYSHVLALSTPAVNGPARTISYEVSASTVAGTQCIEVEYGATSALGSTTGPVACVGDVCRAEFSWTPGPLYTAYKRLGGVGCATELRAMGVSEDLVE